MPPTKDSTVYYTHKHEASATAKHNISQAGCKVAADNVWRSIYSDATGTAAASRRDESNAITAGRRRRRARASVFRPSAEFVIPSTARYLILFDVFFFFYKILFFRAHFRSVHRILENLLTRR